MPSRSSFWLLFRRNKGSYRVWVLKRAETKLQRKLHLRKRFWCWWIHDIIFWKTGKLLKLKLAGLVQTVVLISHCNIYLILQYVKVTLVAKVKMLEEVDLAQGQSQVFWEIIYGFRWYIFACCWYIFQLI